MAVFGGVVAKNSNDKARNYWPLQCTQLLSVSLNIVSVVGRCAEAGVRLPPCLHRHDHFQLPQKTVTTSQFHTLLGSGGTKLRREARGNCVPTDCRAPQAEAVCTTSAKDTPHHKQRKCTLFF